MTANHDAGDLVAVLLAGHVAPDEAQRLLDDLAAHGVEPAGALMHERIRELAGVVPTLAALAVTHNDGEMASHALLGQAFHQNSAAVAQGELDTINGAPTPARIAEPGWLAQARRNVEARGALLEEFGALTSEEVADISGSRAANRRSTAYRWRQEKKIFAVCERGRKLHPSFEFDLAGGRPRTVVASALAVLPPGMRGWALALWWTTPLDVLDGARPVDRLADDHDAVLAAARREAADWAQAADAGAAAR